MLRRFGAGWAAVAISLYLANQVNKHDRPNTFIITVLRERLDSSIFTSNSKLMFLLNMCLTVKL